MFKLDTLSTHCYSFNADVFQKMQCSKRDDAMMLKNNQANNEKRTKKIMKF